MTDKLGGHKKKRILLILPLLFCLGCEDEKDTTPPVVSIISPQDGSTVSEITTITCMATDNESIDKVELWVDGSYSNFKDSEEPYSIEWNTITFDDGSHVITARAYDDDDNKTDSDPITLLIDNSQSAPSPVKLNVISYQENSFYINWSRSNDSDFSSYALYESYSEDMSNATLVFESSTVEDTTYIISNVIVDDRRYYYVDVSDAIGLISSSNSMVGSSYKKIVFVSSRDNNGQIYRMDIDGAGQTNISNNYWTDYNPIFTPDGNYILFQSQRNEDYDIYIMDINGNNEVNITNSTRTDKNVDISRDGNKIVFVSERDENDEIYTMDIDGTNLMRITTNDINDNFPKFSYDGNKIVFQRYYPGAIEIMLIHSDGSNEQTLTDNDSQDQSPIFTADGNKIIFTSYRDENYEVYIMDLDGSNQINLSNHSSFDYHLGVSPDGSQIIFARTDLMYSDDLLLMDLDGTNQTYLTNSLGISEGSPNYSSDGSQIVYQSSENGNWDIYIMNSDGSNKTRLTDHVEGDSHPIFQP